MFAGSHEGESDGGLAAAALSPGNHESIFLLHVISAMSGRLKMGRIRC
jgi:hypothetical protein